MQTVLITGATKGIGFAISKSLSEVGYNVIGLARNSIQSKFPGTLFGCDLADAEQTDAILLKIRQEFSDISCIVNNVGIALPQSLGEIDLQSFYKVFDLNVRVALQVTQAFIPQMKLNNYGRIVNITSRAIFGVKNRSSYSAAKCALVGFTKTWALELATYGITVNAVAPGPIETDLFRTTRAVGSAEELATLATIPMGRIGQPEEVAATVKFLLSKEAGFITGQNICVDGGGSI